MDPFGKFMKVALALALGTLVFFAFHREAIAGTQDKKSKAAPQPSAQPPKAPAPRVIEMSVTERGYEPSPIRVKKGEPLKLVITRKTDATCATSIVIDELKLQKDLPLQQPVEIAFTPEKSGTLSYGCAMGRMISGVILVE